VINKIYELKIEGLKEYLGNYSYYIEKKKNPLRFQEEEEKEGKSKTQIQLEKKKKRDQEKSGKEIALKLKNIENSIADLETKLSNFQNDLCLEEVYSNPEKSLEVNKHITDTQSKLDALYEEWEEML
jgi:ATP-binding cassette, subfamily F, member 3